MLITETADSLDPRTFDRLSRLIYQSSGISLQPGKEALLSARVSKRMRALGLLRYRDYMRVLRQDTTGTELVHLLDVVSTNVTSFFREPAHFDLVAEQFRIWLAAGQRRFRFWCAACSTGQEPYSLAMTLLGCSPPPDVDLRILATDLSTRALDAARRGQYPTRGVAGISRSQLRQHFTTERRDGRRIYTVSPRIRDMVVFSRLNLAEPPFPMQGPFDIVLCRNVMIYFGGPVRDELLREIHRLLRPGGYLLVGHAESLAGAQCELRSIYPSVFLREQ